MINYQNMNINKIIICFVFSFLLFSTNCKQNSTAPEEIVIQKEDLIEWNRNIMNLNRDIIEKYIKRHEWEMNLSESGLYWQIYYTTNNQKIQSGDIVSFNYTTSLLSGEKIYSSSVNGPRELIIDKNQEESGLNEGIKKMKLGEKARLILPPHLAFGVAGDGGKIPPYAPVIFDIEIISINK